MPLRNVCKSDYISEQLGKIKTDSLDCNYFAHYFPSYVFLEVLLMDTMRSIASTDLCERMCNAPRTPQLMVAECDILEYCKEMFDHQIFC